MPQTAPSRLDQMLLFARNFFKHPVMLGSVIPSSRFLIEEVLRQVDWERARVFVEYGPGVGTFTGEILRRMHPEATLVVLETNREFVDFLRSSIGDERLHVIHGSAADVQEELARLGFSSADYIVSGIPFSTMPEEVRASILCATRNALDPQGAFLVYQFSARVLPYLEQVFRAVHRSFEPLNILPAHFFYCVP